MSTKKKSAAQLKREQAAKDKKRSKADAKAFACVFSYSPAHGADWQGVVRLVPIVGVSDGKISANLRFLPKENVDIPMLKINTREAMAALVADVQWLQAGWEEWERAIQANEQASAARDDAETAKLRKLYPEKHTPKLPAMADAGGAA